MDEDFFRFERVAWERYESVAGLDEAGRGAWAGPVVAAAVIFTPVCRIDGVDDSKKLTPSKREKLYAEIVSSCVAYGVGIVDSRIVDEINILQATKMAMRQAVAGLHPPPDFLLIDGNAPIESEVPQQTIIDGDALSFTIAAASILAKVTRDRLMVQWSGTFPQHGFDQHKGYGTKRHQDALKEHGITPIHRRSYAPIAAINPK
jgi:ribonuclease HII